MEAKLKDGKYCYPLKLDGHLQPLIKKIAKKNKHTINDEIVVAVENHIKNEKSKKWPKL